MAADIIACVQQLISLLNVGEGASVYSLNTSDGRYSVSEIVEAAVETDEEVRRKIRENPEHWAQADELALSSALAHGDRIPERVGQVGEVLIQRVSGGEFISARGVKTRAEIERLRANTGTSPNNVYGPLSHTTAASPLSGFYDISADGYLRFTGNAAKVRSAGITRLLRTVYDGAMTSGSATLSSATAAFTASDALSLAVVEGARSTSLLPLASQIAAYVGTTSVTLRDANSSGGAITGKRVTIARLGSPAAYLSAVVRGARGRLWKEGDNTEKAPAFAAAFLRDLEDIRGGARALPDQMREAA
jgi:hypothetical protein